MFAYRLKWESAPAKIDIVTTKYFWKLLLGVDTTCRKETVYYNSGFFSNYNFSDFSYNRTPPGWSITLIFMQKFNSELIKNFRIRKLKMSTESKFK